MKNILKNLLKMSLALSFVLVVSCNDDDPVIDPVVDVVVPTTLDYVGSQKCGECHTDHYARFIESGHPNQMTKIVDGKKPIYPFWGSFLDVKLPVIGGVAKTWNDVSYTLGGYGWKMRFIDKNGYFYTGAGNTPQWNNVDGTLTAYQSGDALGTYGFGAKGCGQCHVTDFKSTANGATPKDGLIGMGGDFKYQGTQCETCHGMGNRHAVTKSKQDITMVAGAKDCKPCHWRRNSQPSETNMLQQTSGGWQMHREQVEQLSTNKHNSLSGSCNACHDPHSSVKHDKHAKGNGVKVSCTSCHKGTKYENVHKDATCLDCHMPKTASNGKSINKYLADGRNHNFKINIDPAAKYLTTPTTGPGAGSLWANYDGKGTTLDFACYSCHKDVDGIGGTRSWQTMTALSVKAATFHK